MATYSPGSIPASARSPIRGGGSLLHIPAANFAGMDAELKARFGDGARVLAQYGSYRTKSKQGIINPGLSWRYSDHCKGLAIDIDNQRWFRDRDNSRFVKIAKRWGFRFNVYGEPWHAVNDNKRRKFGAYVYKCTEPVLGKTGWYYLIGEKYQRRTRNHARAAYWVSRFPYAGAKSHARIVELVKAARA